MHNYTICRKLLYRKRFPEFYLCAQFGTLPLYEQQWAIFHNRIFESESEKAFAKLCMPYEFVLAIRYYNKSDSWVKQRNRGFRKNTDKVYRKRSWQIKKNKKLRCSFFIIIFNSSLMCYTLFQENPTKYLHFLAKIFFLFVSALYLKLYFVLICTHIIFYTFFF